MQGRITEEHLPEAEAYFPGIGQLYREMSDKPATFLDLVWQYEGQRAGAGAEACPPPRRARKRRAKR